ncbi:hypothetical protein [Aquimarina sediminis]|uniref:hypothetical protein n=1 Tax=Aquimarina sediminis TaxID=2070536 RepID=UPI000CA05DE5|nr:hypothetical protein [Aquimarina sediminis]
MLRLNLYIIVSCFNLFILYGQQNYKYENFGDKSILLNGNVTGSVSDLGATYYNPARLTTIKDPLFSINGKIYQLSEVKTNEGTHDNHTLKSSEFSGLPHMVAGTFKLNNTNNHHFAYSLLSRNRSNTSISYSTGIQTSDIIAEQVGLETYVGNIEITNKINEEWYGVSWATKCTENLSIGISGYFSSYEFKGSNSLEYSSIAQDSAIALYRSKVGFVQKSYGFFGKVGIAYSTNKLELGINIDIPYIEFLGKGRFNQEEFLTGLSSIDNRFSYNSFENLDSKRKYPLGIQFGTGLKLGKNKLHFNINWNNKKKLYDRISIPRFNSELETSTQLLFQERLKDIVNFGLGIDFFLNTKLSGYASYSTDFSPYITNATLFDLTNKQNEDINLIADFNHYGLGVNFSVNKLDIVLGGVLSSGGSNFNRPLHFPSEALNSQSSVTKIKLRRYRILVGLNLTIDQILKK